MPKLKESIKRVWCYQCIENRPPSIRKAAWLVPVRKHPYDLLPNADFDTRLIGVCAECLKLKNTFQIKNKEPVNVNNNNLVYKAV